MMVTSAENVAVCPECGEARIRVPSGFVCPNGHGRIYPAPARSSHRRRRFLAWREKLPRATRLEIMNGRPWPTWNPVAFEIQGRGGVWRYEDGTRAIDEEQAKKYQDFAQQVVARVQTGGRKPRTLV